MSVTWRFLKAWFPYRCICRICLVCRTKKIHRTDRIHSISYNKLYLSYEFFSYDGHDRDDRYNDMETRLKGELKVRSKLFFCGWLFSKYHLLVIKKKKTEKVFILLERSWICPKSVVVFQFERPPFCVLNLPVTSKIGSNSEGIFSDPAKVYFGDKLHF